MGLSGSAERFNLPYFLPSIYNSVIVLLHFDSTKWSHLHTYTQSRSLCVNEYPQNVCAMTETNRNTAPVAQWLGIGQQAICEWLHVLMDQLKAMRSLVYLPWLPALLSSVPRVIRASACWQLSSLWQTTGSPAHSRTVRLTWPEQQQSFFHVHHQMAQI